MARAVYKVTLETDEDDPNGLPSPDEMHVALTDGLVDYSHTVTIEDITGRATGKDN